MDERIARIIRNIETLEDLAQFEANAGERKALTGEVRAAIRVRSGELGRRLIAERTNLDLSDLSPAEEKIIQAVSEYAGVKKREGSNANRTISQIAEQGLLGAAEIAVAKSKPTQGFQTLSDSDRADLTYEQIVLDHPEEFSPRALWFSRRALGLPNASDKPPARAITPTQIRTEALLSWLQAKSEGNSGLLPTFTNAEAAGVLDMPDLSRFGRVFGNIQSRIDFACYVAGLPPLGLAAEAHFERAWQQRDRSWAFPIDSMRAAARSRVWAPADFARVLSETAALPGQAHLVWNKEVATNEARVRAWAFGLEATTNLPPEPPQPAEAVPPPTRNPPWSRDELVLALDLYLRFRGSPPTHGSPDVAELSEFLGRMGRTLGLTEAATFRNANGVYMKMMNFMRLDPEYTADGRVSLARGGKGEEAIWNEFADNPLKLADAVAAIRATFADAEDAADAPRHVAPTAAAAPYWAFVCNPRKWAIDRFLDSRIVRDTWGVRPADRHRFAAGQLGIVRVGVDRRTTAEREGRAPLEPGIYALCEVEGEAFEGTGANDDFWSPGQAREPGWPTVNLRYLRTYLGSPLTIERLKAEVPALSPLLLNGFQAASFPISAEDFRTVASLLGEDLDDLPSASDPAPGTAGALAALERKYLHASPEVKEKVSRTIERGSIGAMVKRANGHKCQVCEALGVQPIGFLKPDGDPYVEAHHVMPVASMQIGSLAASNIMTVCANHHRQMHYGGVEVTINAEDFAFAIDGKALRIARLSTGGFPQPDRLRRLEGAESSTRPAKEK